MTRKSMLALAAAAMLTFLLSGGCGINTVTLVIDFKVGHSEIHEDADGFEYFTVDLMDEEDWRDHRDQIKSVDNVGFEIWTTNVGSSNATGQMFASASDTIYADTAEVRSKATLILSGLNVPAGEFVYVDWPTSLTYIQNVDYLKGLVQEDVFNVYALTTTLPFEITIDSARVIVTVTATL